MIIKLKISARETENYVRVRVVPPDKFEQDSFRVITLDAKAGIKSTIGKLKGAKNTSTHNFMFDRNKGWDEKKAMKWVRDHESKKNASE